MAHFIPSFHFDKATDKLKPEWCKKVIDWHWYNGSHKSLLHNKKVREIEEYASGEFDLAPFKMMFKSMKKAFKAASNPSHPNYNNVNDIDTVGLDWSCYAAIPTKLNSAISIAQKIPVEITCTAVDPLAAKKKQEDIAFLKNKPQLENDIQEIADRMGIGKVDLGTTKHSAVPFSDSPYGLDLNKPDELDVFVNLLYSLAVETSFETILQACWDIKQGDQIKLLEIRDQFKFGVSAHSAFESSMTGLPDIEYEYPDNFLVPHSDLPDFSDNPYRFKEKSVSAMELFNLFGDEIGKEENFDDILNADKSGYCACNNKKERVERKYWHSFKVELVQCEIKSIDWIGVIEESQNKTLTSDQDNPKITSKIWGQNTYTFYWLKNTRHFFAIDQLGYAYRTKGKESFQNFSSNIYRSQKKSAVELAIGENKKIQIAEIKMQHAIIKSLPSGKYIDLRYLRNALSGLSDENNQYTIDDLVRLAMEQNVMIGDTEGFEGKNDGQLKPFQEIIGGLKQEEIKGYLEVIAAGNRNISSFTGINEQLTGQSTNPDGLIGLQKLLINSSLNALYYCNEAIEHQEQRLFTIWSWHIKNAVDKGGDPRKAIENIIGNKKVSIIDALDELPLHDIGVMITVKQREIEKAEFKQELNRLKIANVISPADEFMLNYMTNPKDQFALLAVRFKQWQDKTDEQRKEQYIQSQQLLAQQGKNAVLAQDSKTEGRIKEINAKVDGELRIRTLAESLGLNKEQFIATTKHALQRDRNEGQIEKSVKTIQAKKESEAQSALPVT